MAERRYLGEVQGLRAVAALLVAVYHIWLQRVSGGVDVFFVVSAYFMTAALLRREPIGFGDVLAQVSSTLRRIVPGAMLVVVATVGACLLFLPEPLWDRLLPQAWWALLFAENFALANSVIDYLLPRVMQTPFQQMWALSLQVQMLLAIAVLWLACGVVGRGRVRMVASAMFGLLFVGSLAWSIVETQRDQVPAYYLPATRAWEFAAGVLAALWIERLRVAPGLGRWIGYVALLVLVSFGLVIDVSRQFPGIVAAIPVICALAIIVAAHNGAGMRLLDNRVMRGLGEISFAFYLWHWPLLVLLRLWLQRVDVGLWGGLAVIGGAGLLALASTRLVEAPLRRNVVLAARPVASLAVVLLCVGVAAAAAWGWQARYQSRTDAGLAALEAYRADPVPVAGQIVPEPIVARFDVPANLEDGCNQELGAELVQCDYGDRDAATVVAVVGGSHMAQWMDVFDAIGQAQGFRVVSMTKNSCTFTSDRSISRTCTAWNDSVVAALETLQPRLVVALATRTSRESATPESIPHGYATVFAELEAQRIGVLGLRDNPRFDFDVVSCVARYGADAAACGRPRAEKLGDIDAMLGDLGPNVRFVDTAPLLCDEAFCPVVRDGVLLYRDAGHLTRTLTLQLTGQLSTAIAEALATPF